MKHFDAGAWADFVRDQVAHPQRQRMEEHLRSCHQCEVTAAMFSRIRQLGEQPEPDAALVDAALDVFPAPQPATGLELPLLTTRLLESGASSSAATGLRGGLAGGRHLTYQVNNLVLELRLQEEAGQPQSTLVGMIGPKSGMGSGEAPLVIRGLPVYLLLRRRILARTRSNEFGEFLLEFEPRTSMRLCVPLAEAGGRIEVPLSRLLAR